MNSKIILAILATLTLPYLAACSSTGGDELALSNPQDVSSDPSDAILHAAVQDFLTQNKGPKNSQYEYVRRDLNGDGVREGLVLFSLPHSHWCSWGGCTLAVFEPADGGFRLVSETSKIRGPLVIGSTRTNGWEDIGVRLTGNDQSDHNVLLQFDGMAYPQDPLNQTILPYDLAALGGLRVFP